MDKKIVHIGMVTFNRLSFTRKAIAAVAANTCYPYCLTVIDNGSQDGTPEYLRELRKQNIIHHLELLPENIGIAKASNIAWRKEPDAAYYLKLDNDIVIEKKDWLKDMVAAIEANPFLGALGYNFEPISYPADKIGSTFLRIKDKNIGGACFLIPKRTREVVGYWCEDYGLYGEEDADYCERLALLGYLQAYMKDEAVGRHLPAGRAAVVEETGLTAKDGVEEFADPVYRERKDAQRKKIIQEEATFALNREAYYQFEKPFSIGVPEVSKPFGRMAFAFESQMRLLQVKAEKSQQLAEAAVIKLGELSVRHPTYFHAREWIERAALILRNQVEKKNLDKYKLGSFYQVLEDFQKAKYWFEQVLRDPHEEKLRAGVYFHLGEIYLKKKYPKRSKGFFERCLDKNPNHEKAKEYLDEINCVTCP